jgi:hypothetical protein
MNWYWPWYLTPEFYADMRLLRQLAPIWWRAFSIVTLTALNVTQVANAHYVAMCFSGGALSYIWWGNTRTAASSEVKGARYAYAVGAACGTVFGAFLGQLYGRR